MSDDVLIPVVDKDDNIITHKKRSDIQQSDIYRVTGLWLENSQGNVLLAQRAWTKKHSPGKWSVAASGTVEKDETYEMNIVKEIKEELGVTNLILEKTPLYCVYGEHNFFRILYFSECNWPIEKFRIQKEEVESIKWVPRSWIYQDFELHPENYSDGFGDVLITVKEFKEV